jgi:hypothetical protein
MTLHEAMVLVLTEHGGSLSTAELACEINRRSLYHRRDGHPVPASQISARAKNYSHLFGRNGRSSVLSSSAASTPQPLGGPSDEPPALTLGAAELGERRRRLMRLLAAVDPDPAASQGEGIAQQIARLSRDPVPRNVAACMRIVTESRNVAEYETGTLSQTESAAVEAAWKLIVEWAGSQGLSQFLTGD